MKVLILLPNAEETYQTGFHITHVRICTFQED